MALYQLKSQQALNNGQGGIDRRYLEMIPLPVSIDMYGITKVQLDNDYHHRVLFLHIKKIQIKYAQLQSNVNPSGSMIITRQGPDWVIVIMDTQMPNQNSSSKYRHEDFESYTYRKNGEDIHSAYQKGKSVDDIVREMHEAMRKARY